MTPLDRLADVVGRMTAGPWKPETDCTPAGDLAWSQGPVHSNREGDYGCSLAEHDALGIAALRNLAPLLIEVARQARSHVPPDGTIQWTRAETRLRDILTALDSAITKELGE